MNCFPDLDYGYNLQDLELYTCGIHPSSECVADILYFPQFSTLFPSTLSHSISDTCQDPGDLPRHCRAEEFISPLVIQSPSLNFGSVRSEEHTSELQSL